MNKAFAALSLEPWCYLPDEIAKLTDHQIIHNYVLPSAARAEAMERHRKGLPADDDGPSVPMTDGVPDKGYMMSVLVGMLGMTPQQAAEEYESQLRMNSQSR